MLSRVACYDQGIQDLPVSCEHGADTLCVILYLLGPRFLPQRVSECSWYAALMSSAIFVIIRACVSTLAWMLSCKARLLSSICTQRAYSFRILLLDSSSVSSLVGSSACSPSNPGGGPRGHCANCSARGETVVAVALSDVLRGACPCGGGAAAAFFATRSVASLASSAAAVAGLWRC